MAFLLLTTLSPMQTDTALLHPCGPASFSIWSAEFRTVPDPMKIRAKVGSLSRWGTVGLGTRAIHICFN